MRLNTFAEIVRGWVARSFPTTPRFVVRRREDGEIEAYVRAPRGSRAGHLVIYTWRGVSWVRFAPPNLHYPIADRRELSRIVRQLLRDRLAFVATYRGDEWRGTTLVNRGTTPVVRRGETAEAISWSGLFDATGFRLA